MCSLLGGDHEVCTAVIPFERDREANVVLHDGAGIKLGIRFLQVNSKAVTHPAEGPLDQGVDISHVIIWK
jgi:hypothetical protein